jgi:hypothetical protein
MVPSLIGLMDANTFFAGQESCQKVGVNEILSVPRLQKCGIVRGF